MKLANNNGKMAFLLDDEETKAIGQLLKNAEVTSQEFAQMIRNTNLVKQIDSNNMILTKVLNMKKEGLNNNE